MGVWLSWGREIPSSSLPCKRRDKLRSNPVYRKGRNMWGCQRERDGRDEIFELIMTENFPKLTSDTKPRTHKIQRTPNMINPKKSMPRHIIVKLWKIKRTFKAAWEKGSWHAKIPNKRNNCIFIKNHGFLKGSGMAYTQCWKEKNQLNLSLGWPKS